MTSIGRQTCYFVLCLLVLLSVLLNARIFLSGTSLLEEGAPPTTLDSSLLAVWSSSNTPNNTNDATIAEELSPSSSNVKEATNRNTRDRSLIWKDGCQVWDDEIKSMSRMRPNNDSTATMSINTKPPTGIAVTLAKRKNKRGKDLLNLLCQKIPTQQAYFYEPQNIDLLILIEIESITYQQVADCLKLQEVSKGPLKWLNLDGSTLTTYEYRSSKKASRDGGNPKVYLAPFEMQYPEYIQQNASRLTEKMEGCDRGTDFEDYVQGTRYYSNDVLQLKILKGYDYLLKVDLDIEFKGDQLFPFHLLHDMRLRGAIFGHSGEFLPKGFGGCTKNINHVVDSFVEMASMVNVTTGDDDNDKPTWARQSNWKRPCSAGVEEFDRGKDQYYTNLVVMSVDFFQSEHVRAYGKWMNEYYPGFFRYGWTDQLFFHKAMGLFLGPDFREYVADYTDFRCKKFATCWFPWAGMGKKTKTTPSHFCAAGGIFHHGKARSVFGPFNGRFPNVSTPLAARPYVSQYQHDCSNI
ncbi:unnamed protein product [Cylindrotheca closterium]|uniref:Uncharacterized protein n=1 Tax=Cylindrotheca closterium TaxID=2856 RepID=A0AAD2FIR5_9STRA|nr:unnamed protein product [Cylindrotheca closterium]